MRKIGKREWILLIIAIIVFLMSFGYFCYREIPNLLKPGIYYRTYTKESGWSKWSKNGETSGNKNAITAIQIKLKGTNSKNVLWEKEYKTNGEITGNKKDGIKEIKIKLSDKLNKKYTVKYKLKMRNTTWDTYSTDDQTNFAKIDNNFKLVPCKYIQIKIEKRK